MGLGRPDDADGEAADAMFGALNTLDMEGRIVVGEEGKLGRHSRLDSGTMVGTGNGPKVDLVVDPIDGRRRLALGYSDAMSVVGVALRDSMAHLEPPCIWRRSSSIAAQRRAMVAECMDAPAAWTLALVARMKGKPVRDLVVFVLDRPAPPSADRGNPHRRRRAFCCAPTEMSPAR